MRSSGLLCCLIVAAALVGCRGAGAPAEAEADEQAEAAGDRAALQPFPCVDFAQLQKHLPKELEGLTAVRDEGSSGKYGEVSISEAERVFSGAKGQEVSVRIVDTTLAEQLGRAIRAAAEAGQDRDPLDPSSPILQDVTVGFVRFDRAQQKAEANLLVADRFVVAVTTRGFEDARRARQVADSLDIAGLALLR